MNANLYGFPGWKRVLSFYRSTKGNVYRGSAYFDILLECATQSKNLACRSGSMNFSSHKIVVCALFYKLKNHLEGKESYWLSVKAINENIGSDSEAYRYLSLPFITNRILYL